MDVISVNKVIEKKQDECVQMSVNNVITLIVSNVNGINFIVPVVKRRAQLQIPQENAQKDVTRRNVNRAQVIYVQGQKRDMDQSKTIQNRLNLVTIGCVNNASTII